MSNIKNLSKLIEESGLGKEEKKKLIASINDLAQERILTALTNALNDADAQELEQKLAGEVKPEQVMKFLQDKLPNYQEIVTKELEQTRKDVVGFLAQ